MDRPSTGFDIDWVNLFSESVSIPFIASSGTGKAEHFSEVFEKTDVEAALAAWIFHGKMVPIGAVKGSYGEKGIETRQQY